MTDATMELITDRGNFHSMKILISSHLSKVPVSMKIVNAEEQVVPYLPSNVLPALLTRDQQYIFSSNAAARYVLGEKLGPEHEIVTDMWMEWEVTQLRPLLHRLITAKATKAKTESSFLNEIKSLLAKIENQVKETSKNGLGVVLRKSYSGITAWFDNLSTQQPYQDAVKKVMGKDVWNSMKTSILAQPLPPSVEICRGQLKAVTITGNPPTEAESSSEAVTPEEVAAVTEAWKNGLSRAAKPKQTVHPVLPEEGKKNILITSALPYVNNVPHLGNIVGCVLSADTFARFCRLRNLNTLYICGTDEYGTATETKAVEEGLTPQQICDKYNALHAQIYQWFNIGFDYFGRTTTKQQTECAQDIFWKLNERGYISTDTVEQLQCVKCDRFLADRFVEGTCPLCAYEDARGDQCDKCGKLINAVELKQPRCKLCQSTPVIKSSQHLFLDLPKLEPLLVKHLDENFEKGIWSSNTKVISKSWIRDGLRSRCITRDLKWGTPVPLEGFTNKVFYVWYDAPIGYISITANYTDQWEKWWKNPQQVDLYQFMAKDNVPFHSVIFPSCQLGTGDPYTVVNHLSATEYLNYEDGKFSKSRGVGVFGNHAKDTGIPADVWRFYLLYIRPESQDSAFSWDDFQMKNNSELLNNLGNFINRALMFLSNNFGGVMPTLSLTDEDLELLALISRELKAYVSNLEKIKARAATVVGLAANISCLLSVLVQPYMPDVSATIQQQLQATADCNIINDEVYCYLQPGHIIGKPEPLFKKIDAKFIQDLKARFAGRQEAKSEKVAGDKKAASQGAKPTDPALVEQLTKQVTEQGDKVRELKGQKAEKDVIAAEVAKLLELKTQLAAAQGVPAEQAGGKKKKGKKK